MTATERVKITAGGRDFQYAVKLLKKRGGTFEPATKTWVVPVGSMDGSPYVEKVGPVDHLETVYRDWDRNTNSIY